MKLLKKLLLSAVAVTAITTSSTAKNMDRNANGIKEINAVKEFGLTSSDDLDQSAKLQAAIDKVSKSGGGELYIPAGTYRFKGVRMATGVHLVVDKGAVFKPYYGDNIKQKMVMLTFSSTKEQEERGEYIKDCSLTGINGERFTVDYSFLERPTLKNNYPNGIRFIMCRMVKDFKISDINILDNYSTYCGIILVPASEKIKGVDKWKISRPTDGVLENCSLYKGSSGYGLTQLHGALRVHFENLYSMGGVTLRLETGAGGKWGGVFDITGHNIRNEYGLAAVMLGPHTTINGDVKIDGIISHSSARTATVGAGFNDGKNDRKGRFGDGCELTNIKSIYGIFAQIHNKSLWGLSDSDIETKISWAYGADGARGIRGPAMGAVTNAAEGIYKVKISNIIMEGYPEGTSMGRDGDGIKYPEDNDVERQNKKWEISKRVTQSLKDRYPETYTDMHGAVLPQPLPLPAPILDKMYEIDF